MLVRGAYRPPPDPLDPALPAVIRFHVGGHPLPQLYVIAAIRFHSIYIYMYIHTAVIRFHTAVVRFL